MVGMWRNRIRGSKFEFRDVRQRLRNPLTTIVGRFPRLKPQRVLSNYLSR